MYRASFLLFISTLFFAPLAFGTVEPWSMAIVQLLICCSAICLVWSLRDNKIPLLKVPGTTPLIILVLWMFFQILPLPPSIAQIIAPSINDIYAPIHSISPQDKWTPLTVNQKATLFESMRIATYALFYYLTVQLLSSGIYLKKIVRLIAYLAIGIAFLAIIQKFSSPDKIYWFRATPEGAGTVGPWVYHNHFAGFMEMVCPLVFALFFFYQPSVNHDKPLRIRIAEACTMPGSNLHVFLGFGFILIFSSVFISLSRGGILSLSLSLIFFLLILPRKITSSRIILFCFLAGCIVLSIIYFGWEPIVEKFGRTLSETEGSAGTRLTLWQDSLKIVRDFFVTGTGFGTFIYIYPLYKSTETNLILHHAHNDYIELLSDGGIIGFILAAWFVLTIIRHGWKRLKIRRERYAILITTGALTGIVSILFHSVTDFNMHNGANGLYFFFLCGLLVSAGNTRLYYRTRPTLLDKASAYTGNTMLVGSLLLLGLAIVVRGGTMLASAKYSQVANIYLSKSLRKEKILTISSTAQRAARFDPLEGKYPFALGNAQFFLQQPEKSLNSFLDASEKDPLSGIYLQRLALILSTLSAGDKETTENLMQSAFDRALNKEPLILAWAEWLLSMNKREKAIKVLHQVFTEDSGLVQKFMPSLLAHSFSPEEMKTILPDSAEAWIHYGKLCEMRGDVNSAEFYRAGALDFLDLEKEINPSFLRQLYWFYYRQKKYEHAIIVLRKAIEILPEHAPFHVYLGDYYREQGIPYRAIEEYEQALLLEPADEETRKKLEELRKK